MDVDSLALGKVCNSSDSSPFTSHPYGQIGWVVFDLFLTETDITEDGR